VALLSISMLVSCNTTKVAKKKKTVKPGSNTAFMHEMKKIKEKKVTEKPPAVEPEKAAPVKAVTPEPVVAKITPEEERPLAVASLAPATIIEEVVIAPKIEEGIIVDESSVDEFSENYEPLAEKDGFKETEENLIREEMLHEVAPEDESDPVEEIEVEDIPVDEEAKKEFENLKKLTSVKELSDLDAVKRAEEAELLKEIMGTTAEVTYDVPIVINKKVEYFIEYFQSKRMRKVFNKWLKRSTKYLPMMRKIFHEKGLPMDLTYLAMIESGFNTRAYSRARAVGPWQFMRATGRNYGLKVNHWVDERRDPVKATKAAANYLSNLYDLFGSWYLAGAAYNAGEGKVGRAIKKHKTKDFWKLAKYKYLKRETKNYIPKFIAATIISKNPSKYGFPKVEGLPEYDYDTVIINEPTDLEVIAKSAGVKLAAIKELNPEINRWYTPPEQKNYEVKIPKNTKARFLAKYKKLKPSEKINFLTYRIKYGETLSNVAMRFGTSVSSIMKTNRIRNAKYVRAGVTLTIPIKGGKGGVASYKTAYKSSIDKSDMIIVPKGETIPYKVKRGDTLWDIAERSSIDMTDIIKLNNLRNSKIYPGKTIRLYKEPKKVYAKKAAAKKAARAKKRKPKGDGTYYTVKQGDSLWTISQQFKVSVRELRSLNNLRRRSYIKPDQQILISRGERSKRRSRIQVASAPSAKSGNHRTYKVRRGDTLWAIAKKHKMAISEIKKLNNLRHNKIKPGDMLKVKSTEI
ncbi:LysM peptidoglycan-binding domain-containing protein, partial [Thermodesulfobacteriota bacterium]